MLKVREGLLSRDPFVVRRQVLWGECDPAGFVYTPRFADYAVGAAAFFNSDAIGDCLALEDGTAIGLPVKAMSYSFEKFLRPHDIFDMQVDVGEIGERIFELRITARSEKEPLHFTATMTRICLDPRIARSVAMPAALHERLISLGGTPIV